MNIINIKKDRTVKKEDIDLKKIFKVLSISCLSLLIGMMMIVPASAEERLFISENNIQDLDQFVTVENNQFILKIPEYVIIDDNLRQKTIERVAHVNQDINNNRGIIDVVDKRITYEGSRVKRSWAHQTDMFWWGGRHIFRTNNSANSYAHSLETRAIGVGMIGAGASLLGFPLGGAFGTVSGAYLRKIASDVRYQKTKYRKIELNVTWALVYRVIEWND